MPPLELEPTPLVTFVAGQARVVDPLEVSRQPLRHHLIAIAVLDSAYTVTPDVRYVPVLVSAEAIGPAEG